MQKFLFIFFILFSTVISSQTNTDSQVVIEKKARKWDTLKYQKFERALIVGLYQQYRTFNIDFKQTINRDTLNLSSHTYSTEIDFSGAGGIVINYDKFQLSISQGINPPSTAGGKGHTNVFGLGLSVGDNRWVSETYFKRFKGFYNSTTPNFDSSNYNQTKQYYLQPSMVTSLFMTRFMRFRNHEKYSYKAGFGCNYRQLKSAASFIWGGSFSVFDLKNDSAIIPQKARFLYNDYSNMKGIRSVNLSANVGIAATIVIFKAWFIGGYFTLGPEQQWRNYNLTTSHRTISYIGWSGTGRVSFGLNMKRFYMIWAIARDYNVYNSTKVSATTSSYTANTTFGWRFKNKTPKFYEKFMKTKIYSYL